MCASQSKITIIIPTYNRPWKLQRAVRYYAKYGVPVIIADGSPSPCELPLEGNVAYYHYPDLSIEDRVAHVSSDVTTPYVCLAADDDFVSPSFLGKACLVMDADSSVAIVFGKCCAFHETTPCNWKIVESHAKTYDQEDVFERLASFFNNWFSLFYAPTKTQLLKECFYNMPRLPFKYATFFEFLYNMRLIAAGKLIFLEDLYLAREFPEAIDKDRASVLIPQEVLRERPELYETANSLLSQWTGFHEDNMFSKYVITPYDSFFRRLGTRSLMMKLKTIARQFMGDRMIESLKIKAPFLAKTPPFIDAVNFKFSEALLEIEQCVLRSLEEKALASKIADATGSTAEK